MSFQSTIALLADLDERVPSASLVDFSGLDTDEASQLAALWPDLTVSRRLHVLTELAELAVDNIELNFDAVNKLALDDDDGLVRAAALRGLFEYEGRDLIDVLIRLLRDDQDSGVRREAAISLGRFALAAELGYLADSDADAIKDVLIESAEDLDEDETVRARAIEALGAISGEETQNLIESLYDEESPLLRIGAVDAMGRSANEDWLPIVLKELTSSSAHMRHAAAFAAGEIGVETAIPGLRRLVLADIDREVQQVAIHAIGEIGGSQAKVALKSLLYEGDDELREAIEEALTALSFQEDLLIPPI